MSWTVELPWTKPPLSLNDRYQTPAGRRLHSLKVQRTRGEVAEIVEALAIPAQQSIHVRMHYRPRDRRRRDADNLIATQKPCIDALVTAGLVPDDCAPYVDWSRPMLHEPIKGEDGALWLVIEATEAAAS